MCLGARRSPFFAGSRHATRTTRAGATQHRSHATDTLNAKLMHLVSRSADPLPLPIGLRAPAHGEAKSLGDESLAG
jgi:hypothetical protein